MPVSLPHTSQIYARQLAHLAMCARSLGSAAVLALAATTISGAASAQQAGYVYTAPTSRAPNGLTVDQGAGVPGMAAYPFAPHPTKPHPHGPENPQAGVPGTQDPSALGD